MRDDAAAKIHRIEEKVQDLPNIARDTVDATVQQAKDTVDESLHQARAAVGETVSQMKSQMDLPTKIEERPLAAIGIAFAGGYLLGKLFGGGHEEHRHGATYRTDWSQAHSRSGEGNRMGMGMGMGMGIAAQPSGPGAPYGVSPDQGFAQGMTEQGREPEQENGMVAAIKHAAASSGLDDTLSQLTSALVATLTDQFHKTLEETFPDFAEHLREQGGMGESNRAGASGGGSAGFGNRGSGSMGDSGAMGGSGSMSGSGSFGSSGSMSGSGSFGSSGASGTMASGMGGAGANSAERAARVFEEAGTTVEYSNRPSGASSMASPGGMTGPATTDATGRQTPYYGGEKGGSATSQP
jgi:ElaB/YqjD/DUF883 family membrane-anchored ribosome-binding protein